jgi:Flp pilus assembly protein TadG
VETAFVLSAVMLFMIGIFEYARFVYLNQVMFNAAREGSRYAVVHTGDGTTLAQVQAYVTQQMAGRDSELANFTITVQNVTPDTGQPVPNTNWNDSPTGGCILVRVEGDYAPMLPAFLQTKTSMHLTATSMMSSEAN